MGGTGHRRVPRGGRVWLSRGRRRALRHGRSRRSCGACVAVRDGAACWALGPWRRRSRWPWRSCSRRQGRARAPRPGRCLITTRLVASPRRSLRGGGLAEGGCGWRTSVARLAVRGRGLGAARAEEAARARTSSRGPVDRGGEERAQRREGADARMHAALVGAAVRRSWGGTRAHPPAWRRSWVCLRAW